MTAKPPETKLVDTSGQPLRKIASISPAYTGSSYGRAGRNWYASGAGPSFVTYGGLETLRNRARDLVRNDPWISRQAKVYTANLIGKGIRPVCKSPDQGWNREVMELWNDWVLECDVTGKLTFYAMQSLAARCLYTAGEGLIRDVYGADEDSVLPYQIQILEADYLDHTYNTVLENGRTVVQGVEFGRYKPVAYHLFKSHPSDFMIANRMERVSVPASEIQHFSLTERPGQVRGVPLIASILLRIMDMLEYEEAELTRKKFAAMFVAFVKTLSDDAEALKELLGSSKNDQGEEEANIESGTMQHLRPGEDVTFNPPAEVGGTYEPFMKNQHRAMAAGGDSAYEHLTGDLSQVNFTSARVGLNMINRIMEQTQEHVIKPQICIPTWRKFIKSAIMSGQVGMPKGYLDNPRPWHRASFMSPAIPFVNPVQEEQAAQMAIRGGTESRENIAAIKGYDMSELDEQTTESNKRVDEHGLVYDTDPRKVTKSGNASAPTEEGKP